MSNSLGLSLSALCYNLTILRDGQPTADQISGPLSVRFSADLSQQNGSANSNGSRVDQSGPEFSSRDKHALLYIIVVLLFYSTGIVIAIVNYLKREKKEIEEEKAYEDYAVFRSDPDKMARYFRVQKMISYLNKVDEAREAAALRDRLQGRASCPLPGAGSTTTEPHPLNIRRLSAARFSLSSDHVIRSPFKHIRRDHVVQHGPEAEVDGVPRRQEQGTRVDCCWREAGGENEDEDGGENVGENVSENVVENGDEEEIDHDVHLSIRTTVSHV